MTPTIEDIAHRFTEGLRGYLSNEALASADALNRTETNPSIDHVADLCDANHFMVVAIEDAHADLGCYDFAFDAGCQAQADLWNAAWDHAKTTGYASTAQPPQFFVLGDFASTLDRAEEMGWHNWFEQVEVTDDTPPHVFNKAEEQAIAFLTAQGVTIIEDTASTGGAA